MFCFAFEHIDIIACLELFFRRLSPSESREIRSMDLSLPLIVVKRMEMKEAHHFQPITKSRTFLDIGVRPYFARCHQNLSHFLLYASTANPLYNCDRCLRRLGKKEDLPKLTQLV